MPPELSVINPTVEKFGETSHELAPRLATLSGKKLGLIWNAKANGDVALWAAAKRIEELIPDVEVIFYSGQEPCQPALLEQAVQECDAFLACTADCGGCCAWLIHDCVQLERGGKPTAVIVSGGFEKDIHATSEALGMATIPYASVPRVYNNITVEEAKAQTLPVAEQLISLLTTQDSAPLLADDEAVADRRRRAERTITFTGTSEMDVYREFNRVFADHDWGDGYPLWPATADRVEELCAGIDGSPDDFVCVMPPGNGRATVRLVAANAAMAGCKPEEMPVILAALRAIANMEPVMRIVVTTSTSAHAPMVVVNGPIAGKLGINGGQCCMGPGKQNDVNIRIGRAIVLSLKNLGRWYPGVLDMDTMGSVRKNCPVIAENEAESPWEPQHVTLGYDAQDSTVTVFWTSGEIDVTFQGHLNAEHLAHSIGSFHGGNQHGYFSNMQKLVPGEAYPLGRLLLLAPPHARPLYEGGYTDKVALQRLFWELGQEPIARLRTPLRKLYMDGKIQDKYNWLFELPEEEARTRTLPVIEAPERYRLVVAGSVRAKNMLMTLRGNPVTERITSTPAGDD